jgi:Holliday junction resolvase RusA-like endonuclease
MKIILLGNPISTNSLYKRHGNFIYMTKEGKALKESYQWQAKKQYKGKILTGDLEVDITLYFGDKRRRDADNHNKIWSDSLQGIVFEDDKQIVDLHIHKRYDKSNPRVEIILNEL